ncbi:MAG: hypothetical protein HAW67_00020, partial [Endozoicomonadaceae bacterium]|nr:hypothetical protein [Endozoicomonadaceae bacterium]
ATSFFTHSVLPRSLNHQHVDYQTAFYLNKVVAADTHHLGYVYGIIRVVENQHPVFDLTEKIIAAAKQSDSDIIILLRDPRDILVSMYFSFGISHGLSPNLTLREYQQKRREQVKKMTIDDYVMAESTTLKSKFSILNGLMSRSNCLVLRYEDLINDYDEFYSAFSSVLPMPAEIRKMLFEKTRPNEIEDPSAHKRSGKIFAYREKLSDSTINNLNNEFKSILQQFNYPF